MRSGNSSYSAFLFKILKQIVLYKLLHRCFRHEANRYVLQYTTLYCGKHRYGSNVEERCKLRLAINVDLAEFNRGILRLNACKHGGEHFAGAAPICVKIYEARLVRLFYLFIKITFCYDNHKYYLLFFLF